LPFSGEELGKPEDGKKTQSDPRSKERQKIWVVGEKRGREKEKKKTTNCGRESGVRKTSGKEEYAPEKEFEKKEKK